MNARMRLAGDSYVMSAGPDGSVRAFVGRAIIHADQWDYYLHGLRAKQGQHGVTVTDEGAHVTWRTHGVYEGRHRLPYGCDPEGWPDGLVFWSTSAARWMRVAGYTDEPL